MIMVYGNDLLCKSLFQVADTQKNANIATNLAVIDYDKENLEPPILSVEEAVERCSFFEVHPSLYPKQVGDLSKGMAEADHQILSAQASSYSIVAFASSASHPPYSSPL